MFCNCSRDARVYDLRFFDCNVSLYLLQAPEVPKSDNASEPVFYGGLPSNLWKNIFLAYGVKGVIDLCAGEGEVCKAAMSLRKPCLALCFSDVHVKLLFDHLVTWMLANMADAGNIYHNANYKAFKAGTKPAEVQKPAPQPASTDPGNQPGKKHRLSEASKSKKIDKKRKRRRKSSSDASESSSSDD